uniref:Glutathione S-transferase D1 n=1 Tax=Scolopendra viridis TaxID=118503 RepID=A0A4D5R940_SCOVI
MAPIIFYNLKPSPPCRAALLTIRLLGLDIEIKELDIFGVHEHKESWFKKINPAHSVPTIDDNGFYLWESRAIMGYVVQQYAKDDSLYPKNPKLRAQVDKMLYFDVAKLYSAIHDYFVPIIFKHQQPGQAELDRINDYLGMLDTILQQTPYAAGKNMTIADISLLVTVTSLEALEIDYVSSNPNVHKWVQKLKKEIPMYDEVNQPGLNVFAEFIQKKRAEITG